MSNKWIWIVGIIIVAALAVFLVLQKGDTGNRTIFYNQKAAK